MIIALVRHGETDWNRQHRWQGRSNQPLNELGRRQADAAGPVLADREWFWMVTSPLERAHRTGLLAALHLPPMPITIDDELVERDYGQAEGMPTVEADERWPNGAIPGLEPMQDLQHRGARAVRGIASRMVGDGIIVAHGGLIRALIDKLCGPGTPRILNGSVSMIEHGSNGWRTIGVNMAAPLADLDAAAPVSPGDRRRPA